jgi:hypothetical protein
MNEHNHGREEKIYGDARQQNNRSGEFPVPSPDNSEDKKDCSGGAQKSGDGNCRKPGNIKSESQTDG